MDNGNSYEGEFVALDANIDLDSVANWNPIGSEADESNIFNGTFDGQGYTISNLTIDADVEAGASYHGLFSILGNEAVVKNLNITDADITVSNAGKNVYAGSIAGATQKAAESSHEYIGTRIDSCSATGSVSAKSAADALTFAGGIAGSGGNGAAITNCWSDVSVSAATSAKNSMAGGIIGMSSNYAVIANCATFGDVAAEPPAATTSLGGVAGGLVGTMAGKQYNSYAMGDMTIGNGSVQHTWIGALDGEINGNYTDFADYPGEGALRLSNYYAEDVVLKVNGSTIETVDRGYTSAATPKTDKVAFSTAMEKADMKDESFAEILTGNIKAINSIVDAYSISGIALREWEVEGSKVLPTGDVWVPGEVDNDMFAGGSGTEEDPYPIANETQFNAFAGSLSSKIDYTGQYIDLSDNITIASGTWSPIGGSDYLFNGTFDGQGHSIEGMRLGSKNDPYALNKENLYIGLFGILGKTAVVKDVHLKDVAFYTAYSLKNSCVSHVLYQPVLMTILLPFSIFTPQPFRSSTVILS